jgi:hypothetical protein
VRSANVNESRGYGFIKPSDNSHDVFYHFTALTPGVTPRDGERGDILATVAMLVVVNAVTGIRRRKRTAKWLLHLRLSSSS